MSDLISRQAAIEALRGYLVGKRCPDDGTLTCRLIENEVINKLPPAQLGTNLAEVGTDTISRQAAIDGKICIQRANGVEIYDDYVVPVEYLKQLPSALPEPMKIDLSRCSEENWERIKKEWANTPITAITAEPERIKGHWIEHDDGLTACECSVCHEKYNLYEEDVFGRNFCPNCGADMREVTK